MAKKITENPEVLAERIYAKKSDVYFHQDNRTVTYQGQDYHITDFEATIDGMFFWTAIRPGYCLVIMG